MYWFHKIVFTLRNIIDLSEISFRWTDDTFYVFLCEFRSFYNEEKLLLKKHQYF